MFSKDLEDRLKEFNLRILNLIKNLPKTTENRIYGHQIIRSASSVGANYAEATCALTRKDFTNDINKCRKEAKETLYWLSLISEANLDLKKKMSNIIDESEQLVKIFQKAVSTARS